MNFTNDLKLVNGIRILCEVQKKTFSSHYDKIGPPDPLSNLHPVQRAIRNKETFLEKKLRLYQDELQDWNQSFWTKHNKSFIDSKKNFETLLLKHKNEESQIVTADEMSVYYKKFLDENWKIHFSYLLTWYKKNLYVTYLHLKVVLHRVFRKKS